MPTPPVLERTDNAATSIAEPAAPAPAPASDRWWLWPLAGLVVAALAWFGWRRQRRSRQADAALAAETAPRVPAEATPTVTRVRPAPAPPPAPPAPVTPEPAAPPDPGYVTTRIPVASAPRAPQPAAPAAPANALGRRADLSIAFEPIDAQATLLNLRIRYVIELGNNGATAAAGVRMRIGLFAGSQAQSAGVAAWFATDDGTAHHRIERIGAGERVRIEGELAAPLDALKPIELEGRLVAIPLVGIDVRYGHGAGDAPIEGQVGRAFVLGREAQSGAAAAKLAPFRLDQGPQRWDSVAQRDLGIGRVA